MGVGVGGDDDDQNGHCDIPLPPSHSPSLHPPGPPTSLYFVTIMAWVMFLLLISLGWIGIVVFVVTVNINDDDDDDHDPTPSLSSSPSSPVPIQGLSLFIFSHVYTSHLVPLITCGCGPQH